MTKRPEEAATTRPRGPRRPQEAPKMPRTEVVQDGLRKAFGADEFPGRRQDGLRKAPGRAQDGPRNAQGRPRGPRSPQAGSPETFPTRRPTRPK